MENKNDSIITENTYLFDKNIEECKRIFEKTNKSPNDIIDFLLSLHLVLEIGINSVIRDVIVNKLQKGVDKSKIVNNLDRISFIDKATLFVYMEKYNFSCQDEIEEADKFHSIIGCMKSFSEARNILMHGGMIGSFFDRFSSCTNAVSILNIKYMNGQISKFKMICDGLKFYLDHLSSDNLNFGNLKDKYLNYDFIS